MTDAEARMYLNAPTAGERLSNLKALLDGEETPPPVRRELSNNHIHTTYSFSPYSPTAAVWFARQAGLPVAGIMDHDSIGGAAEFRKAAALAGVHATCGLEARVSLAGTPFADTRLNSPDQTGIAYVAFHSIREEYFERTQAFFAPLREKRNDRNRAMTENIRRETGQTLDFDRDVLPISQYADGGSVTERHLMYALAGKLLPEGTEAERFKLLGELKKELVPKIYIPANEELISLDEAVAFAKKIDAILCYAYLGDVTASPTGDKKAQKFEDDFLPELAAFLREHGVDAITFMPSRNTEVQLARIMALCRGNGFRQISGEDINSLGQSFICERLAQPAYAHLVEAAWDLTRREGSQ